MPPSATPRRLDGLLFFPVTAFDADGRFAAGPYREHVEARLADGPGAVRRLEAFAAYLATHAVTA